VSLVKVFFTVDVEIWPGSWTNIDARFPKAFKQYVYGDTPRGQYGLPMTLQVLGDHGLHGVFFVEPVFSARFGLAPLEEVVGLIKEAGQDVQMHLHAEWVNEARAPLLSWTPSQKIQHLSHFALQDQIALIAWSMRRLHEAGADPVTAFRAGSFAFNRDTLRALETNGVHIDSSYNHCFGGPASAIWNGDRHEIPVQPFNVGRVLEFPVTVFRDFPTHLRPLQLTACSLQEMIAVLRNAADNEHSAVVIVSHNFELLDRRDFSADETVVRRFRGLCKFLSQNTDRFEMGSFRGGLRDELAPQPRPVAGSMSALAVRYLEQLDRKLRRPARDGAPGTRQ
jgi:hypothetical protein